MYLFTLKEDQGFAVQRVVKNVKFTIVMNAGGVIRIGLNTVVT